MSHVTKQQERDWFDEFCKDAKKVCGLWECRIDYKTVVFGRTFKICWLKYFEKRKELLSS